MKKVLGMGNALVDIMTRLEHDDFLKDFNLEKGSMQLVDKDFSAKVIAGAKHLPKEQTSGGSAANTIHGLAQLGVESSFIGKIGDDEYGVFFGSDIKAAGIKPVLYKGKDETGRAVALVSQDSERTFATFLGAAIELSAQDLSENDFRGNDIFHIEGYLVQNYDLIRTAIELARKYNMTICLDLASYNVVEQHLPFLKSIVKDHVDIVFANEEEARAFTGHEPHQALEAISEMCTIAIVKTGKEGSLVKSGNVKHSIKAISANCIDTTGAGDLYAAGFIYGLVNSLSLDRCGNIGSLLAGNVIEHIGAKISNDKWNKIREAVKSY
jgi:sugar/nucleoside kinase (ribokinase family)